MAVLDSKPSSLPDQTHNLANLIGVMRKHDLTNKKTTTKTKTKRKTKTKTETKTMAKTKTVTMTMKMTNTFREHLQRAISETFDL